MSQQFTQGNITTTDNPIDLAINGNGFFQVTDGNNPVTYTRNGQFKIDRDGYIVNNQLQRLIGYPADGTGAIQPGAGARAAAAHRRHHPAGDDRDRHRVEPRLAHRRHARRRPAPQIDFADATTYNNATSLTVYDAARARTWR